MRRVINLLLVLSLALIPVQQLLAEHCFTMGNDVVMDSMESHHTGHTTLQSSSSDTEKKSAESCNNSNLCCFSTGVLLANNQFDSIQHPDRYVESQVIFHNAPYFPELRPPRNA